jgi:hypothetical protein
MAGSRKRFLESEAPALYSNYGMTSGKMVEGSDTSPTVRIFTG